MDVAVVGIGCRYPGSDGAVAFWDTLANGRDAVKSVPAERRRLAARCHPDPAVPGSTNMTTGGFLGNVRGFDPSAFRICRKEAPHVDPQQRLLLECTWEAIEDSGRFPFALSSTNTGVFVGGMYNDYRWHSEHDLSLVDAFTGAGSSMAVLANRVSHVFGLHGPSISLDTACSSSLVAIHLACRSLADAECDFALAGGVNVILSPLPSIFFTKSSLSSPSGRCRPFDERADGIVRSEGAGMLLLCPLEKAIAAGDRIYGVILGSAVNHDGTTNGITAPNPLAQARVVAAALERAKIKPDQVQYLETHGTGTVLGDRIEAKSLLSVFSPRGAGTEPLRVGALKSNIGHAESAAGVGGLVKVLLSLRYETLPPSLHSEQPIEPFVAENSIIRLQSVCESWPAGTKRIAGVSGFGFGGTNAHVIIGEPSPFAEVSEDDTSAQHPYLFTLSAVCQESLEALVRKTLTLSEQWGLDDLKALCWTSNRSRAGHAFRLAILTERTEDLRASLRDLESHSRNAHIHHGRATRKVRELTLVIGNTRLSSEDEQLLIARFHAFAEAQREVSDANLLERGFSAEDTAAIGSLYSVARLLLSLGVRPCRFEGIGALGTSLAQVLSGRMNLCNLEKVSEVAVLERKSDVSCRPTLTLGISNDPWLSLYGLEESTGEQTTGSILWDVPTALARLYCSGADISFDRLFRSSRVVDLPSYPWHREEFWISDAEEPIALSAADAAQLVPGLPTSQSLERVRTDGPSIAASAGEISRSLEEVLRILREQVAQELAIASSADIDLDTGFFELGMDSLMALRIKARVESLLGLQLRDSVVLEYPTVRASGVHIHSLLASSSLERRVKDDVEIASGRHRLASRRARV